MAHRFEFEFQMQRAEYVDAFRRSVLLQPTVLVVGVLGIGALAIAAVLRSNAALSIGLPTAVFTVTLVITSLNGGWNRSIIKDHPIRYILDEYGVEAIVKGVASSETSWAIATRTRETAASFIVVFPNGYVTIPKRVVRPEELLDLRDFLERVAAKGATR